MDALAGMSLADAETSAIEARLRELEERTGPSRDDETGGADEELQLGTTATISLIEARLAALRASFARDESALLSLSLAGNDGQDVGTGRAEPDTLPISLAGTEYIEEGDEHLLEGSSRPSTGAGFEDTALEMGTGLSQFVDTQQACAAPPPEPGPVVLNGPHAVLVANGKVRCIAIADCWANGLTLVTSEGMVLASVGGRGEGHIDERIQRAAFNGPHGLCKDKFANIFVADAYNQAVRRVTPLALNEAAETVEELLQAQVLTVAGTGEKGLSDGPAKACRFCYPHDVEVHYLKAGAALLVADFDNNCIRRVTLHEGVGEHVVTWAGSNLAAAGFEDGRVQDARFNHPGGLARSHNGEDADIVVADTYNHAIRLISHVNGQWEVKTIAGCGEKGFADGVGAQARFNCPTGVAIGSYGDVYVADFSNHAIRMLRKDHSGQWSVTTLVGRMEGGMGAAGYVDGSLHDVRCTYNNCTTHTERGLLQKGSWNRRWLRGGRSRRQWGGCWRVAGRAPFGRSHSTPTFTLLPPLPPPDCDIANRQTPRCARPLTIFDGTSLLHPPALAGAPQ